MRNEPPIHVDKLANAVIDAAFEVHRFLGPGYLERTYEEALSIEFSLRKILFSRQHAIALSYKGRSIGEGFLDFLVGGELIVEIKTVNALAEIHKAQVISYLKATGHTLGLLLNFNVPLMKEGIKRIVYTESSIPE
ncbi:MAG: GxxExxY protein [Zavarzinella sp.]